MSFGKIFETIYDGTLAENWKGLVTFQQLIILCDANGIVDMTPGAISRRTGIPLEVITAGLEVLEAPDLMSRSKSMDGRRIARLSDEREWGWFLVNHGEYRRRIAAEEKREADRVRIAEKRNGNSSVADCREESQDVADGSECREESPHVADVAHTEADTDTDKPRAKKKQPPRAAAFVPPDWIDANAWAGYLEMRKRKRAPPTDHACELVVKKLDELRRSGHDPTAVLAQSTRNSWTDVYPVRDDNNANRSTGRNLSAVERVREAIDSRNRRAAGDGAIEGAFEPVPAR